MTTGVSTLLVPGAQGTAAQLGYLLTASKQKLDGTAASASSTAFADGAAVLISAPEAYHLEIGVAPTATTNSTYMPAGLYETGIHAGYSIAVIKATASTAGNIWVTPYGSSTL